MSEPKDNTEESLDSSDLLSQLNDEDVEVLTKLARIENCDPPEVLARMVRQAWSDYRALYKTLFG